MLGYDEGPLFPTARPSSSATGRFSIRSLQRLVNRLAEHAGLGRRLGPHALRHGCATAAIMAGVDLPTVQRAMRHENLATTSLYSHVAHDARRDAFEHVAALIPRTLLPLEHSPAQGTRNPSGSRADGGAQAPVDIHPAMDDIRGFSERRDATSSQQSPQRKNAPLRGRAFSPAWGCPSRPRAGPSRSSSSVCSLFFVITLGLTGCPVSLSPGLDGARPRWVRAVTPLDAGPPGCTSEGECADSIDGTTDATRAIAGELHRPRRRRDQLRVRHDASFDAGMRRERTPPHRGDRVGG